MRLCDILECIYVTSDICHNMLSHVGICSECCKDVSGPSQDITLGLPENIKVVA